MNLATVFFQSDPTANMYEMWTSLKSDIFGVIPLNYIIAWAFILLKPDATTNCETTNPDYSQIFQINQSVFDKEIE